MGNSIYDCPGCGFNIALCRCPSGGAADEEKSEEDNETVGKKRSEDSVNNTGNNASVRNLYQVINKEEARLTLLHQKDHLLYCTFFASPANQSALVPSNDLQEEVDASNTENTSLAIGMKMGGMDQ
jgi:hypothetical protein